MKLLKIIITLNIFLFTSMLFSQNVVDNKYVAFLGKKVGNEVSSYFYTELDFKEDKVIVTDYTLHNPEDVNNRYFVKSIEYSYTIEDGFLTIVGATNTGRIEIFNYFICSTNNG